MRRRWSAAALELWCEGGESPLSKVLKKLQRLREAKRCVRWYRGPPLYRLSDGRGREVLKMAGAKAEVTYCTGCQNDEQRTKTHCHSVKRWLPAALVCERSAPGGAAPDKSALARYPRSEMFFTALSGKAYRPLFGSGSVVNERTITKRC